MIELIKSAVKSVQTKGWSVFPVRDVAYSWIRYLLDELEKAQKENMHQENRYQTMFREILPVAQQRDRYYAELEILRTEHTAMKEALEEIASMDLVEGAPTPEMLVSRKTLYSLSKEESRE